MLMFNPMFCNVFSFAPPCFFKSVTAWLQSVTDSYIKANYKQIKLSLIISCLRFAKLLSVT